MISFDRAKREVKAIMLLQRELEATTDGKLYDRLEEMQVLIREALEHELDHMGGLLDIGCEERQRLLFDENELMDKELKRIDPQDLFWMQF